MDDKTKESIDTLQTRSEILNFLETKGIDPQEGLRLLQRFEVICFDELAFFIGQNVIVSALERKQKALMPTEPDGTPPIELVS